MVKRRDIPINVNDNCSPPHIQLNTTIVAKLIRFVYLQHKNLTIFIESLTSDKMISKPVAPSVKGSRHQLANPMINS